MRTPILFAAIAAALACSAAEERGELRFARVDTGAVRDTHTGLVWTSRDSGRELSWPHADEHCRALARDSGGPRWKLPRVDELATLYDTSLEQSCSGAAVCRIDPAIDLTSPYQWSATAPQPNRRSYYDFSFGTQLSPLIRPALTRRALCTRAGEDVGP